jgi:hypothetical protein
MQTKREKAMINMSYSRRLEGNKQTKPISKKEEKREQTQSKVLREEKEEI